MRASEMMGRYAQWRSTIPEWKAFVAPDVAFLACLAAILGPHMSSSLSHDWWGLKLKMVKVKI